MTLAVLALMLSRAGYPDLGKLSKQDFKLDGGYRLIVTPEAHPPTKQRYDLRYGICEHPCRGGKHLLHPECDSSCDKPCPETHQYTFETLMTGYGFETDLAEAVKKLKAAKNEFEPRETVVQKIRSEGLGDENARKKLEVKVQWKHWAKGACARSYQYPLYWTYPVDVKWKIVKEGPGMGAPTLTEAISGSFTLELRIPTDESETDPEKVACACSVVDEKRPEKMSGPVDEFAFIEKCGPPATPCSAQDLDKFGFEVVCTDMNQGVCSATNYMPMPVDLCAQEGVEFECVDESAQDCLCVDGCTLHLPAANPVASVMGGPIAAPVSAPVRLQCLNLHKDQPRRSLKYRPVMADSTDIVKLAKFQKRQLIGGPWDQIRTWIYTDHATLEEIGKVMLPPPGEGAYLKAAYQLATVLPNLDWSRPEFRRCLEPRLIVGNVAGREATRWLVDKLGALDPDGLAEWVGANGGKFAPLWTNVGLAANPKHLADVASALMSSGNPGVRRAGIRFLLETVPPEKRDLIVRNNGCDGLASALVGCSDAEEASLLLDAAEAYRSPGLRFALRNVNEALPAALRTRAAKLLAAIEA